MYITEQELNDLILSGRNSLMIKNVGDEREWGRVFFGATQSVYKKLCDKKYDYFSFVDIKTMEQSEFFVINLGRLTVESVSRAFANAYFEEDSLENGQKFLNNFYRGLYIQPKNESVSDFEVDNPSFRPY